MGWYIYGAKDKPLCRQCKKPVKKGEKFYFIESHPLVVEHFICYWESQKLPRKVISTIASATERAAKETG